MPETTKPHHEVQVRFEVEKDCIDVDVEVDARRAGALLAAISTAAESVRAIIRRLEVHRRRHTVDAHFVLAADREARLGRREREDVVTAILGAIQTTLSPTPLPS